MTPPLIYAEVAVISFQLSLKSLLAVLGLLGKPFKKYVELINPSS